MPILDTRSDFPVLLSHPDLIYLDSISTTLVPKVSLDAVNFFLSSILASTRRGAHTLAAQGGRTVEEARKSIAKVLGTPESEVSFQKSIPTAIASFAYGYDWKGNNRDTVLIAESEEHSTLVALQRVSQILDLTIKTIPIDDNGTLQVDALTDLIDEKTGIVAAGSTTIGLGTANPLSEISQIAHERGALLLSDLSRSMPYDLKDTLKTGLDVAIFSANTSLMGIPGLSIQWIEPSLGAEHIPGILGGSSVTNVIPASFELALQPDKFESDVLNVPAIAGLSAAIDYLMEISFPKIADHIHSLSEHMIDRLGSVESISIYGIPTTSSTIFSFNLGDEDTVSCHDIALFLDQSNIAVRSGLLCAHPLVKRAASEGVVQASLHMYNTIPEIDLFADTLKTIAKDLL
jgi:cysteine desulfurase/selenocysteine lyase